MNISDKRRAAIYTAISRPITDMRLQLIRERCHSATSRADAIIAQVETKIFEEVLAAVKERSKR